MSTFDPPAGVIDFARRFPTLASMGAFAGWPVNAVGTVRDMVANYTQEVAFWSPLLRYGINLSVANLIGPAGLRPQPKLNAAALNISEQQAEDIGEQFESLWAEWAEAPCDPTGTLTFNAVMGTVLRRSFDTGEGLIGFDFQSNFGTRFATVVNALDPQRISRIATAPTGALVLQGIELDAKRRPVAVWFTPSQKQYGNQQADVPGGIPERYSLRTSWGRPMIAHSIMDRLAPGVVRGVSPIAACIERAARLDMLTDLTIRQQAAQLAVAYSLVSEYDAHEAAQAFDGDPEERVLRHLTELEAFFSKTKPPALPDGAKAILLPKGSKLSAITTNFPTQGYDVFTRRLQLELARGFGIGYSELTGDYSQDSFSSAKMSNEGPWAITYRRRNEFVAPLYNAAYENILEEAFNRQYFKLPRRAADFYAAKALWTNCTWAGPAKPIVDAVKEATANDLELKNGSTSLAQIAHERGLDWRDILKQRAREKTLADELGIDISGSPQVNPLPPEDPTDRKST